MRIIPVLAISTTVGLALLLALGGGTGRELQARAATPPRPPPPAQEWSRRSAEHERVLSGLAEMISALYVEVARSRDTHRLESARRRDELLEECVSRSVTRALDLLQSEVRAPRRPHVGEGRAGSSTTGIGEALEDLRERIRDLELSRR